MIYKIAINKANEAVEVDFANLPENVQKHIIEYGIKQKLNDKHSQIKSDEKDAPALVMELVQALLSDWEAGKVAASRSGGVTSLEKVIHRLFLVSLEQTKFQGNVIKSQKAAQAMLDKIAKAKFGDDVDAAKAFLIERKAQAKGITPDAFVAQLEADALAELAPKDIELDLADL